MQPHHLIIPHSLLQGTFNYMLPNLLASYKEKKRVPNMVPNMVPNIVPNMVPMTKRT